jgi:hypothetical protein
MTGRMAAPLLLGLLAAACDHPTGAGGAGSPFAARWRPRLVLVALDLSASVDPATWRTPVKRLSEELRGGDRLVLLPLTGRADDPPLLDTTLTERETDRLSDIVGLSTRTSRQAAAARQRVLTARLLAAADAARRERGPSQTTAIIDAACSLAEYVRTQPGSRAVAIMLSDGVEEGRWISVARAVPSPSTTRVLADRVRAARDCPLATPGLRLRLIGVRHANTPGLTRWWRALLTHLGYPPQADDISPHPLGPLLGQSTASLTAGRLRAVRDPRGAPLPSIAFEENT